MLGLVVFLITFTANLLHNQLEKEFFENRLRFDKRYCHEYGVSFFYGTRCITLVLIGIIVCQHLHWSCSGHE